MITKTLTQCVAAADPSLLPSLSSGQYGALAMTLERELFAQLTSGTGITADVLQTAAQTDGVDANALATVAFNYGFNEAQWDRIRAFGDSADAVATGGLGRLVALARGTVFNGTAWDRVRSASAANQALASGLGAIRITSPGTFSIHSEPAVNVQATISRAAVASQRHVATTVAFSINAVAAIAGPISVYLRDGASGAGTILKSWRFAGLAAGDNQIHTFGGLQCFGSVNTAMTLEFSAAPGATNFENVSLEGYTTA